MGIQSDRFGASLHRKINLDASLVAPWRVRLEVEEGDVVVGGLDAVGELAAGSGMLVV